jgi:hypothetical protein
VLAMLMTSSSVLSGEKCLALSGFFQNNSDRLIS